MQTINASPNVENLPKLSWCVDVPDLFSGITTAVHYPNSTKAGTCWAHYHFTGINATEAAKAFQYQKDTIYLADRLAAYIAKLQYNVRYLFYKNYELCNKLKEPLTKAHSMLPLLRSHRQPAEMAREVDKVHVEIMRMRPDNIDTSAFISWFKIEFLISEYLTRYSA